MNFKCTQEQDSSGYFPTVGLIKSSSSSSFFFFICLSVFHLVEL